MEVLHVCLYLWTSVLIYVFSLVPELFSNWFVALVGYGIIAILLLLSLPHAKHSILFGMTCLCTIHLLLLNTWSLNTPCFGFPATQIVGIEGHLVEDSFVSRSGKQVLRLELAGCTTKEGFVSDARGCLTALATVDQNLPAGATLNLRGTLDQRSRLFLADDLQLVRLTSLARLRRDILAFLQQRLDLCIEDETARDLATMLLLGQSSQLSYPLKDLSTNAGCSHVLALSGMHLHVFLTISVSCFSFFLGRFKGKVIGSLLPLLYVVLVGPKPSLVRALGIYLFSLLPLPSYSRFALTLMVQLLLFPSSLSSIAFLYSWIAYALLLVSSRLPPLPLRTTAVIIAGTAAVSLNLEGAWSLAGMLYALPVTYLINLSMCISLLALLCGPLFGQLQGFLTRVLLRLLGTSNRLDCTFGRGGYFVYLLILLTSLASIGYAVKTVQKQRRKRDELDIRIRLPDGPYGAVGGGGAEHEQEVWTELPT